MAKRGRPCKEDPRNKDCRVRVNQAENNMLEKCRKETGMRTADVFRLALKNMYEKLEA